MYLWLVSCDMCDTHITRLSGLYWIRQVIGNFANYVVNLFVDVTFDDVYIYTHRFDMEIETGLYGIWAETYSF